MDLFFRLNWLATFSEAVMAIQRLYTTLPRRGKIVIGNFDSPATLAQVLS